MEAWEGETSQELWAAWTNPWPDAATRAQFRGRVPVPGHQGLRARFHLFTDPRRPPPREPPPALSWEDWCTLLRLEAEVDAAVTANDATAAAPLLARLEQAETGWPTRLVTLHAAVAKGD
ncbi:MAG TPA: hypothetical protein VK507_17855, partial [Iamia sp.]|nr:hypothetical protein [Iamia sp.]